MVYRKKDQTDTNIGMEKLKELREELIKVRVDCNKEITKSSMAGHNTSIYHHGQVDIINRVIKWIDNVIEDRQKP